MTAGKLRGGGLHLDARPRHRLGRRRPRRQCRRAEGRQPPDAAHRPLQPPAGRAVAGAAGAGQPLRDAWSAAPRSMPWPRRRRTRRSRASARSTCWPSTSSAWPARAGSTADDLYRRGRIGRALCRARPRATFDRRRALRRDRRLCARELRALRQDPAGQGRPVARQQSPASPSNTGMNVGTIVEEPMLKVRLGRVRRAAPGAPAAPVRGGRVLGEVEEYFAETLSPGDTFIFAGEVLRFEAHRRDRRRRLAHRARHRPEDPVLCRRQVPALHLSGRARARHARRPRATGGACRAASPTGWRRSARKSMLPRRDEMLVETFPRARAPLPRRLPVRGAARPPDARHAADPPAGAGAAAPAGLRVQPTTASPSGVSATSARPSRAGGSTSPSCSRRTCWATISRSGWRNRR